MAELAATSIVFDREAAVASRRRLWSRVVIYGLLTIFALIYIVLTLVADLINGWLDPRVRVSS